MKKVQIMAKGKTRTSWKPGQSGNKAGRPKEGETMTDILRAKLDKDTFIQKVIELAEKGNTKCLEIIWDRLEGKVKDQIEADAKIKITFENKTKKLDG